MSDLVLVTGASGFVAGHIVRELLARGYRVRGTTRDPERHRERFASMPGAAERLELVAADLLDAGAFDAAVAGAAYVVHTASPYALDVRDPQRELLDPAVRGTGHVLASCARAPGVRRVVLTSSVAAICDEPPERALTEDDWNEKSSLARNPYYYAKTLAERAAWRFVETERPAFDLIALNPYTVIGPSYSPALNVSNKVLVQLLNREVPGILPLSHCLVDVRDVAIAHVRALETKAARGRYICAAGTLSVREIVARLRQGRFGDRALPTRSLDGAFGRSLLRLAARFQPSGTRSWLLTHIGRVPRVDNGRIRRELGVEFRDLDATLVDAVEDLERWGHIHSTPSDSSARAA